MKNVSKSRARHCTAKRSWTGIKPANPCEHRTNLASRRFSMRDAFLCDGHQSGMLTSSPAVQRGLNFRHGEALWSEISIFIGHPRQTLNMSQRKMFTSSAVLYFQENLLNYDP